MWTEDNTAEYLVEVDKNIQQFLEKAGQIVLDKVQINCPVKTGATLASAGYEMGQGEVVIGVETEYAPFVEFYQPFLEPSLMEAIPEIEQLEL